MGTGVGKVVVEEWRKGIEARVPLRSRTRLSGFAGKRDMASSPNVPGLGQWWGALVSRPPSFCPSSQGRSLVSPGEGQASGGAQD